MGVRSGPLDPEIDGDLLETGGVTPQAAMDAGIDLTISHATGHMFVTTLWV
jgi:uncharacterized protein YcsI (UPF0317 family)